MSKQLTLFGKRAVLASYFTNPINDYQRFVNKKWNEASEKFDRKQDFLQFALVEWEKVKKLQRDPCRIQQNLIVKLIRRAKMEHQHKINTLLADPSTSAKKWWGISKSLYSNKCCSSLPDLIDNNIVISDSQHKAQVFNDYFVRQTIMPNADTADIPSLPSSPHNLSIIVVNEYQVLNILYNLDISKACGFDNISNKALKPCAGGILNLLLCL
jgi:hypothetical protein